MTTGNTRHLFLLGGVGEDIDFANFIVFEGCVGCIGVNLL